MPYHRAMDILKRALVDKEGTAADLARHLGVSPPTVSQWLDGIRPVPVVRCMAIELFFGGLVTRRDLRPDDWHLIWPELADPQPKPPPAPVPPAQAAINCVVGELA